MWGVVNSKKICSNLRTDLKWSCEAYVQFQSRCGFFLCFKRTGSYNLSVWDLVLIIFPYQEKQETLFRIQRILKFANYSTRWKVLQPFGSAIFSCFIFMPYFNWEVGECMIKISQGGRAGRTFKTTSPHEQLLPLPTPRFYDVFGKIP